MQRYSDVHNKATKQTQQQKLSRDRLLEFSVMAFFHYVRIRQPIILVQLFGDRITKYGNPFHIG